MFPSQSLALPFISWHSHAPTEELSQKLPSGCGISEFHDCQSLTARRRPFIAEFRTKGAALVLCLERVCAELGLPRGACAMPGCKCIASALEPSKVFKS